MTMNNTGKLKGKTVLITGSSRGIGFAIAKKLAADGANIIIAARTTTPTAEDKETIFTAAKEIEDAGGKSLPCKVDIRNADDIKSAIEKGVEKFGGIDIVINNASNLNLTPMLQTDIAKVNVMFEMITRAAFVTSKLSYPYLKKSTHAHILNISPPLNLDRVWMKKHMAYTAAKYSVSMYTLGMAEEFRSDKIAANSLWPKKVIYSTGMKKFKGSSAKKYCRSVDIMADAAYAILIKDPATHTGNLHFDEEVLQAAGVTDFEQYRADKVPHFVKSGILFHGYYEVPNEWAQVNQIKTTLIYEANAHGSKEKLFPDVFTDEVPNFEILNE